MILSSTRQANHQPAWRACESAGQPLNRVFERYRTAEAAGELEIAAAFAPTEGERRLLLSRLLDVRPEPA
jgi:hypothetical protein